MAVATLSDLVFHIRDVAAGRPDLLSVRRTDGETSHGKTVKSETLSVRATESAVSEHIQSADVGPLSVVGADGQSRPVKTSHRLHLTPLEEELRLALGTKVGLSQTAKGRGKTK